MNSLGISWDRFREINAKHIICFFKGFNHFIVISYKININKRGIIIKGSYAAKILSMILFIIANYLLISLNIFDVIDFESNP